MGKEKWGSPQPTQRLRNGGAQCLQQTVECFLVRVEADQVSRTTRPPSASDSLSVSHSSARCPLDSASAPPLT